MPFLLVPIQRLEDMRAICFRPEVWEKVLRDFAAPHVYAFTLETETQGTTVHIRMFAPAMGIREDPATGTLGCYLVRHRALSTVADSPVEFINEQGIEMQRPSFIKVRIEQQAGAISSVKISGQSYLMGEGFLYVDFYASSDDLSLSVREEADL